MITFELFSHTDSTPIKIFNTIILKERFISQQSLWENMMHVKKKIFHLQSTLRHDKYDIALEPSEGWLAFNIAILHLSSFKIARIQPIFLKNFSTAATATDFLQLGQTVLHMVSITGESRLCALFCRADADPNLADDRRFRPLHWACVQGHKTVARILLNHGADMTCFNEVLVTLFYARDEPISNCTSI